MPTLSSRPELMDLDELELTVDEIVEIIADTVAYTGPNGLEELKMILEATCRTLWNVGTIEDFFVTNVIGGFDVGFRVAGDIAYNVVQIN